MIDLERLNVMITRPKPDGMELCELIKESGGNAIYFPTVDIVPPENLPEFKSKLAMLDQLDWVIFISPQSVYQSAPLIHEQWGRFPANVKVAAMGAGTADALKHEHIRVDVFPEREWSSESVLDLPAFRGIEDKKIGLICGADGRNLLSEELTTRGAQVTQLIAYRRALPNINPKKYCELIINDGVDVIVCTSTEILQNLIKLLGPDTLPYLKNVPLIVVSERMVSFANQLGLHNTLLAKNASHEAIMLVLEQEKDQIWKKI